MKDDKVQRKPQWLRVPIPHGEDFFRLKKIVEDLNLNTVCKESHCPNIGKCWAKGHLTIIILGNRCTRGCSFCNVEAMKPYLPDRDEPKRVAELVVKLNLRYLILTSVTRDDLPDGGADHWAETISQVKKLNPNTLVEALIPDFKGNIDSLEKIAKSGVDILAHNLETVERLYKRVRKGADYRRSLGILHWFRTRGIKTKSGIMVGIGETEDDLKRLFKDVANAGVEIFTIGQYLRPTKRHLEVKRYLRPDEFKRLEKLAKSYGIKHVIAGPLVRSSYMADKIILNA